MIKVLNVISDTNIGGAGKDVITYCNNYDKSKYDIVVVLPRNSKLIAELQKTDVRIIEVDGMKDKSLDISAIGKLKKIFKEEKPDIVHTHASLSARIAARKFKNIKIVYTRHCAFPVSKKYSYEIVRKCNRIFNNMFTDKIIASAEIVKDNLLKQGNDESKIEVVLNGSDGFNKLSNESIKEIKNRYGINENEIVVGKVARLVGLKGYEYYLEAVKILVNTYDKSMKFLIVGTGEQEEQLKNIIQELELFSNVIMTGFISNMEEIYNIMDIQVNASYISETTNLALLEGMSLGIPAVATKCGGNTSVIRNDINGILVEPKSGQEIANGIKYLLSDKDTFIQMKQKSVEVFRNEYTSKIYSKNIEKIYESLVK